MEEESRYITGIDVGTKNVRIVQGRVERGGKVKIIGQIAVESGGLRRGVVSEVNAPAQIVDAALSKLETQSGVEVKSATVSINGESLSYTSGTGMINLSSDGGEISEDDIDRIVRSAEDGHPLPNREILSVEPYNYRLDGQDGIRNPIGMKGFNLQSQIGFVSVLKSDYDSLCASQEATGSVAVLPAVVAASEAVLTRSQRENGVCVVDLGAETTGVVIYEDGVMRSLGVVPMGGHNVTKDLAMMLAIVPEAAEELKLKYATGIFDKASEEDLVIKIDNDRQSFKRGAVDEIIEARMEEIFTGVRKILQNAGYDKRLPEGIILTGGGARMKNIDRYVRSFMEVATRVGAPGLDLENPPKEVTSPEFATAVGLMFCDYDHVDNGQGGGKKAKPRKKKKSSNKGEGLLARFFKALNA